VSDIEEEPSTLDQAKHKEWAKRIKKEIANGKSYWGQHLIQIKESFLLELIAELEAQPTTNDESVGSGGA